MRSTDADVVGYQRLEEAPGTTRVVEHHRARHLHLPHGQLPPVAGGSIMVRQRPRDDRQPTVEEGFEVSWAEAVADRLKALGIGAGGEAVGQLAERDARLARLALRPLVAVHPDLC